MPIVPLTPETANPAHNHKAMSSRQADAYTADVLASGGRAAERDAGMAARQPTQRETSPMTTAAAASDEIPEAPMALLLSYPRQDEMDAIRRAGVAEVVSKPFELADLESALKRAMKKDAMAKSPSEVSVDR